MKNLYSITVMAAAALAAGAAVMPRQAVEAKHLHFPGLASQTTVAPRALSHYAPAAATAAKAPLPDGVTLTTIINEDFASWTAGSEEAPDATAADSAFVAANLAYSGPWGMFQCYQAGGSVYTGFDDLGDDGPGYIMTPGLDLREEGATAGYYRFSCRAKNVNGSYPDQPLQAFILDESSTTMISASAEPITFGEWTYCEWTGAAPTDSVAFMVMAWHGKVFIDDLKVEKVKYALPTPVITSVEGTGVGELVVKWEAVEGATSYRVGVQVTGQSASSAVVGATTEATVGYTPVPGKNVLVTLTACDGPKQSYPATKLSDLTPKTIANTVAAPGTDVTPSGFTANWQQNPNALQYMVSATHTIVPEADTAVDIFDEDFRFLPADADLHNPLIICPALGYTGLDLYLNRADWMLDYGFMADFGGMGCLVLSSEYAQYGVLGALASPVMDFSVGDGKVTVSGMGLTAASDAVVLFGLCDPNGKIYTYNEVDVNTAGGPISTTIEGGRADSRFVMFLKDFTEGGDMLAMPSLKVTKPVKAGESFSYNVPTVKADYTATSVDVPVALSRTDQCSYRVAGYYSRALVSNWSEAAQVDLSPLGVAAVKTGSLSAVATSAGIEVTSEQPAAVVTVDGKVVSSGLTGRNVVAVPAGLYLVKAGSSVVKVVK